MARKKFDFFGGAVSFAGFSFLFFAIGWKGGVLSFWLVVLYLFSMGCLLLVWMVWIIEFQSSCREGMDWAKSLAASW